jgi:hypothetical protein
MSDATAWDTLASALRALHRVLLVRARREYEREHGQSLAPGELLQLLTSDPHFEWLRSLSELMADIDIVREAEPEVMFELAPAVRSAIEHLVSAADAAEAHPFAQHYWPSVHEDPDVAVAHADLRRALNAWPPTNDPAQWLHERHQLAEYAKHHSQRRRNAKGRSDH